MNQKNLILYGSITCPFVQRSRALIEELKVPYEYKEVDLYNFEHLEEWYKKINPLGKVPCLVLPNNEVLIFIKKQ